MTSLKHCKFYINLKSDGNRILIGFTAVDFIGCNSLMTTVDFIGFNVLTAILDTGSSLILHDYILFFLNQRLRISNTAPTIYYTDFIFILIP